MRARGALKLVLTVLGATLAACGGGDSSTSPDGGVATISLSPPMSTIEVGGTVQLTAVTLNASGTVLSGHAVAFLTGDPAIVRVTDDGLVRGVRAGTASIRAIAGGRSTTASVTVRSAVSSVALVSPSANLLIGDTLRIAATVLDASGNALANREITWTSSDSSRARVSPTGLVTGIGAGTVSITAMSEGRSAAVSISVNAAGSFALACSPGELRLQQNSVGTASCTLTGPAGFTGLVTVEGQNLPAGVRLEQFDSARVSVTPGTTTTVFLNVEVGEAAPGRYSLRVAAAGSGLSQTVAQPLVVARQGPRVHVIYLLPSDVAYDARAALGMDRAIRHLQIWFQQEMASGTTFAIANPSVQVIRSTRTSSYFATNSFARSADEVFVTNGSRFYDSTAVSLIFLPVRTDGQGGVASVALLGDNDVQGISGRNTGGYTVARWVGGLGHEMGHAFGLPHPPGCATGQGGRTCDALMYLGYLTYPATFLNPAERNQLGAGPFFRPDIAVTTTLFDASVVRVVPLP